MLRRAVSRIGHALLVAFGVSSLVFGALHLSGDPVLMLVPNDASRDEIEAVRRQFGFDQPLSVQYLRFLAGAARGDFGASIRHQAPALGLVLDRLPATFELTLAALGFALALALPLGILAAIKRGSVWDRAAMGMAVIGQATPFFWLGLMLILVFAILLGWLPTTGRGDWRYLVMPAVTLGTPAAASIARLVRTGMLEVLEMEYVRTARAKGLAEWPVIVRHALKNAAIPVVTLVGLQFGTLLGGAVVTETIFAWPGVGRMAIQAIYARDYPLVQAAVFVLAISFVTINLTIDLLYTYLDPRTRTA